jgi:hypothetical protein
MSVAVRWIPLVALHRFGGQRWGDA